MKNAVKTMSRLAKEKSKTAYREMRSKIKDMQQPKEMDDKPRSAPSSPKFGSSKSGVPSSALTRQLSSSVIDRSLRRCETSVSQHYVTEGQSFSIYPQETSSESESDDELNMAPLNLNLMDDLKDILARSTTSVAAAPPVVDRTVRISPSPSTSAFTKLILSLQRKPSLTSPPTSPVMSTPAPLPTHPTHPTHQTPQPLPLPPLRCKKRSEPGLTPKVKFYFQVQQLNLLNELNRTTPIWSGWTRSRRSHRSRSSTRSRSAKTRRRWWTRRTLSTPRAR